MELLKSFGEEKLPSVIKDPFSKINIEGISVFYSKSCFYPYKMEARGYVDFKNGQTEGKQKFEGETFDEVVLKIKSMMENL